MSAPRAKTGGCAWCGHLGHPMSSGPRPRCKDWKACEARRLANAGIVASAAPTAASRVTIMCKEQPYFFKKCNGILPGTQPHLELVREEKEGTKFAPAEAVAIAEGWGGRIVGGSS